MIRKVCFPQVKIMTDKLPAPAIETLVRHQFYNAVHWDLCAGMDLDFLESEFRAVLEAITASLDSKLPSDTASDLIDEIIQEVCVEERIDEKSFSAYKTLLKTKLPLTSRMSHWAYDAMIWASGTKRTNRRNIEENASQYRVRPTPGQ